MMIRYRDNKGFTFVELLIAIFLLVFIMISISNLTITSTKTRTLSKTITTATTLAQDKLEELKNTPYSSLAGAGGTDYATGESALQTTQDGSFYTRTWTVTSGQRYMEIGVSVTWTWQTANDHSVTLNTRIAKTT